MAKKTYKPNFKKTLGTVLLIGFFIFIFSMNSIYFTVKTACDESINIFEGDCVEALMQITQSNNFNYEQKNHAIWALGQLADSRGLIVLEKLNEEAKENPCKLNEAICKYEVQKAIKWCTKGNLTSWMYKNIK